MSFPEDPDSNPGPSFPYGPYSDPAGTGNFSKLFSFGARSFSIWRLNDPSYSNVSALGCGTLEHCVCQSYGTVADIYHAPTYGHAAGSCCLTLMHWLWGGISTCQAQYYCQAGKTSVAHVERLRAPAADFHTVAADKCDKCRCLSCAWPRSLLLPPLSRCLTVVHSWRIFQRTS